jgi:two-component system chemotaxis response regulator CheB
VNAASSTRVNAKNAADRGVPARRVTSTFKSSGKQYSVLAIGTSTGGPVALQTLLTKLPRNFKLPILLIQHMPGTFTKAFARGER